MKTNEEITKLFQPSEFAFVDSVLNVNYKPHPYLIGEKHIAYASKYCGGILGDEVVKKIGCAREGCEISYEGHTSDKVAFIKLKRDCTHEEIQSWLLSLVPICEGDDVKVDGFCFVETGFQIQKQEGE